jgi:iron complex outermembrane receptor protein
MNSPRANVVSLRRRRRFRFLHFLLFTAGTFQACWLSAAPGDQADSLTQLSLEELGNIKVTSVSKEPEQVWKTPAAIYVITQDDIRRSGATSLPEVLRLAPGVEVARVDSDHWSVGIRGFGGVLSSKLLVLIDGRSVYTPLYAGVYWEVQNVFLEDVERIEVIRGPGGTVWGANAVDGVINIITKSAKDTQGALVTAGGGNVDEATAGVRYGGTVNGFSYRVYGKGFDNGPEFHANNDNFDEWRMLQAGFRSDWTSKGRDAFTFQGDIYDEKAGEIVQVGDYTPPSTLTITGRGQFSGGNLLGRWKRDLGNGSDLQLQAYCDHTNHFEPQFGETRDTFDIDFIHHLTLPKQQDFIWGLGARISPGNFSQLVPTLDFAPGYQTDEIYSGFVQDEIPLVHDTLDVTVGSKLEHNNYTGFEVQPDASLLWTPSKKRSFWVSASRAVRTPSRLEESIELTDFLAAAPLIYLQVNGNRNFVAERLIAFEAGYRSLITSRLYLDLALFRNGYNDLYGYGTPSAAAALTPAPPHIIFEVPIANEEKGFTDGFEFGPEWQLTQRWQMKGAYSYLHMDLESKSPNPNAVEVLNRETVQGSSPHHEIVVQSFIDLPKRLEFDQTYRYVSGLVAQSVGGYNTADARLAWHLTRQFELSIDGDNLLQPHHVEYGGDAGMFVGIKRSVYAKLTWESQSK